MRKKIWIQSVMYFAVVFLTAQISGVIAYQTDEASMCNRFVPRWNESEITEEFPEPKPVIPGENHTITKKIKVTNTSGVPCFVRIFLKSSNSDIPLEFLYEGEVGYHKEDWILGEDGYYYYKHILEEGTETSELIDGIQIKDDTKLSEYWGDATTLSVLVYGETVQAKNSDTGMYWESYEEAWNHYLSVLKNEDMKGV